MITCSENITPTGDLNTDVMTYIFLCIIMFGVYTIFEIMITPIVLTKSNRFHYYNIVPFIMLLGIYGFFIFMFNQVYTTLNIFPHALVYYMLLVPSLVIWYFSSTSYIACLKMIEAKQIFREKYPLRKIRGV